MNVYLKYWAVLVTARSINDLSEEEQRRGLHQSESWKGRADRGFPPHCMLCLPPTRSWGAARSAARLAHHEPFQASTRTSSGGLGQFAPLQQ
jgi:hypothetical protein